MPQQPSHDRSDLDTFAYETVKQLILDWTLKPGEQLVQDDLAKRIGVSRTPLRRALAKLADENLVEMGRRGTRVKAHTLMDEIEVFEIRAVLEGLAFRLAAQKASEADLAYLKCLFTSAMSKVDAEDRTIYLQADRHFHLRVAEIADSLVLASTLNSFQILSVTYRKGLLRPPQETYPEHMAIVSALERRDSDEAERLAVAHIRNSIEVLRLATRAEGLTHA